MAKQPKHKCFGCQDCYITENCATCEVVEECFKKSFEELDKKKEEKRILSKRY